MASGGGQSSGGCKLTRAPGWALLQGILGSLCLRCLGNSQVEYEVTPLCSSAALLWGELDLGGSGGRTTGLWLWGHLSGT